MEDELTQITDNLYISGIEPALTHPKDGITTIVTVCQDSVEANVGCTYHHFNMADGDMTGLIPGDSSYELFEEAVKVTLNALRDGETILVHCHKGQSRSVSTATAALAVYQDVDYDTAYDQISSRRTQAEPNEHLQDHAKQFIESHD